MLLRMLFFCFHFLGSIFHENHCANLKHQARQDDTILPNLKLPRVHGMCLFMVPQGESEARLKKNGCLVNQIVLQWRDQFESGKSDSGMAPILGSVRPMGPAGVEIFGIERQSSFVGNDSGILSKGLSEKTDSCPKSLF
jgi:hypothetical protein